MLSVKKMIEMYLNYGLADETWDMMYNMTLHGLISQENWKKFFEKCKDWYIDEETNSVKNGENKILYSYDENGFLQKVA